MARLAVASRRDQSVIHRCALAVISKRGQDVVPASISPIDPTEEDFLHRHVARLREVVGTSNTRARFRPGSFLAPELRDALTAEDDEFVDIADKLVNALAAAMETTPNASACVVALLTEGPATGPELVSFLKLDAEIEAAQLRETPAGVRLKVFKDLLPRPGEIQKGFSWPDPRHPFSDIIVLDKVVVGSAVKYFQNAFLIDVSPKSKDTETALVEELSKLPVAQIPAAINAVGEGGNAEQVVDRIRIISPTFRTSARELGAEGSLGGTIRPNFGSTARRSFTADNIELTLPLLAMAQVSTRREGGRFVTTIVTSTPLTPVTDDLSDSPASLTE